jgi:L-asparaginase
VHCYGNVDGLAFGLACAARGALRAHTVMEPRLITIRLVPGFDDGVIRYAIEAASESGLRALVLQLYGTGNLPSAKGGIHALARTQDKGRVVLTASCDRVLSRR